jgi:dTDP-4-dehydrorhamnose reductase
VRIFTAGCRGQLAHDCLEVLAGHDRAIAGADLPELDIASPESVRRSLISFKPDIVLNCAAYTRVDDSEKNRTAAWRANAEGPACLAEVVKAEHALLVHLSTDYVFDGRRLPPQPYVETDTPAPLGVYGASKLAGEEAIRRSGARHIIVRTAWLYGIHGQNFLKTILRLAVKDPARVLKVVNDQHGCPTWSRRLAEQIDRLIARNGEGTYHAVSLGHCTWYELAAHFLQRMGVPHRIAPCTTAEYPTPARRPANSILDNRRLLQKDLNVMRDWRDDVDEFVAENRERLLAEAAGCAIPSCPLW